MPARPPSFFSAVVGCRFPPESFFGSGIDWREIQPITADCIFPIIPTTAYESAAAGHADVAKRTVREANRFTSNITGQL